jgi:hypothetical protein
VLARTDALRAVGGFDERADHFDDWAAWLRLADRHARIWSITDAVAEWRIHSRGLSGNVLHIAAMKRRIVALFERLEASLSAQNAEAVAMARQVVVASEIATYDDYVRVMIAMRHPRQSDRSLVFA